MMKLPACVLALMALVGSSDAFVHQATSQRSSVMLQSSITFGPETGGVGGSSLLPSKYGKVDIDNPWGTGSTKPYGLTRVPHTEVTSMFGGPVTGGVHGSSLCPREYEKVDIDNPWGGKNPAHPSVLYYPQAGPGYGGNARLPAGRPMVPDGGGLPRLAGSTGGTQGSSMLPPGYGTVDTDDAWGGSRSVPRKSAPALPAMKYIAKTPEPTAQPEPVPELPAVVPEQPKEEPVPAATAET